MGGTKENIKTIINMEQEPIKPADIMLGNFVECFGKTEIVCGIVRVGESEWYIEHNSWHQKNNPLPTDMKINSYGIPLTQGWKECLKIDKYELPEWIKYVHQAQNYMRAFADVNLLEVMDWDKLPKDVTV